MFGSAVVRVDTDGGVYFEIVLDSAIDPGQIAFVYGLALEGSFEKCLGFFVAAGEYQAGGFLIDTVNSIGVLAGMGADLIEEGIGSLGFVGMDKGAAGLVKYEKVFGDEKGGIALWLRLEVDDLHFSPDTG